MIKIRYADLPGGLYARAEMRGRHTIVYLLPGLTAPQRHAALRRLRSSARMGHAPRLPVAGLGRALVAARVRANARNVVAALRVHPGILAPPIAIIVLAAVAFVLLVPVPLRISTPQASWPSRAFSGVPPAAPGQASGPGRSQQFGSGGVWATHGVPAGDPGPGSDPAAGGAGSPSRSPSRPSSSAPKGHAPLNSPRESPSPQPSPSAAPSRSDSTDSGASGSLCVVLGPVDLCL